MDYIHTQEILGNLIKSSFILTSTGLAFTPVSADQQVTKELVSDYKK